MIDKHAKENIEVYDDMKPYKFALEVV